MYEHNYVIIHIKLLQQDYKYLLLEQFTLFQ